MTPFENDSGLNQILVIVGPTASGKSQLSLEVTNQALQKNIRIELISMDSALVYRGLNIGTAKPSMAEQLQVPHHGIDIRDPWENYSAAQFAKDATRWAAEIRAKGSVPVIVGGTMLYWRALSQGLTNLPQSQPAIRLQIAKEAQIIGWPAMYDRLQVIDPITASKLPPGDTQRISRALEVYLGSGQPMSSWIAKAPYAPSRDGSIIKHHLISLEPNDRQWLHTRMEERFLKMLQLGFLEEVASLILNPQITPDLPAMRAVGYRQAWQYLREEINYPDLVSTSLAATRQLGKRQLTWLRAMPSRIVVDPSLPQVIPQTAAKCVSYIEQHCLR